jgi:cardiolipin synthase
MRTAPNPKIDYQGHTEQIVFDPKLFFDCLIADIDQAQFSIVLETYKFRLDDIGLRVINSIKKALQRGVSVRLLMDGVGSSEDADSIAKQLESDHCQVRIFHPLPWDFPSYRRALTANRWYSQLLYLLASINHRDHRKLCLIDDHIGWLGSFNITADHFNQTLNNSLDNWHDTGLRVTSGVVQDLTADFEQVWQRKIASVTKRTARFLSNHSIQLRNARNQRMLMMLNQAKKRIWITNAYFNPSIKLLNALKNSAHKGIDIRILVPSRSDIFLFPLLSRTYYADLLNAGIQVFELQSRSLHSKTMLIDQRGLIGSTNLNYRSFFHDLELDALLNSADSVERLSQKFLSDINDSMEITANHWIKYPWLLKMLGGLSRFFRYWS